MKTKTLVSGLIVLCNIHVAMAAGIPCRINGQTPGASCGPSDMYASNVTFDPECRTTSYSGTCVWRDSYLGCWCSGDINQDLCGIGTTDETFTAPDTGMSYRVLYNNNSGSTACTKTTRYICPTGYYGTPMTNSMSECTPCPTGGTSDIGTNIFITACYIPANTPQDEETGTYLFTSDCNWSE
ncbi:MAG: hypothetical protein NC311_00805 [Muribaculaceae bacterium]|nr:hypothetical protein [Muribaculaceae bacterium]